MSVISQKGNENKGKKRAGNEWCAIFFNYIVFVAIYFLLGSCSHLVGISLLFRLPSEPRTRAVSKACQTFANKRSFAPVILNWCQTHMVRDVYFFSLFRTSMRVCVSLISGTRHAFMGLWVLLLDNTVISAWISSVVDAFDDMLYFLSPVRVSDGRNI